jgi:hypothetical protein
MDKEKTIKLRMAKELNAEMDIKTPYGCIDLLNIREIVNIKSGNNWKQAVGQILVYSNDYPYHSKRIHLFDIEPDQNMINICKKFHIKVTYEPSV